MKMCKVYSKNIDEISHEYMHSFIALMKVPLNHMCIISLKWNPPPPLGYVSHTIVPHFIKFL